MKRESQVFVGEVHQIGSINNGYQDLVLKYKVGESDAYASFTAGSMIVQHLEPLKQFDIVEVRYNINAKLYRERYINNLLITNVSMVKQYVPDLFTAGSVSLQDSSEFDEFFNLTDND